MTKILKFLIENLSNLISFLSSYRENIIKFELKYGWCN